jgi:hypothetical protein
MHRAIARINKVKRHLDFLRNPPIGGRMTEWRVSLPTGNFALFRLDRVFAHRRYPDDTPIDAQWALMDRGSHLSSNLQFVIKCSISTFAALKKVHKFTGFMVWGTRTYCNKSLYETIAATQLPGVEIDRVLAWFPGRLHTRCESAAKSFNKLWIVRALNGTPVSEFPHKLEGVNSAVRETKIHTNRRPVHTRPDEQPGP